MGALAAIHVGRKALGLDEETYRDLLERVTGKRSAGGMTPPEHRAVIDEMRRLGFVEGASGGASKGAARRLEGPFAKKLQALWIGGWNLGLVRDRRDAALLAFVERQTGISHTRFLTAAPDARAAIEGLKGWLARDGGVAWDRAFEDDPQPGRRIAEAQWRRIEALGAAAPGETRSLAFDRVLGRAPVLDRRDDWIEIMNALGRRVRAAQPRRAA